MKIYLFDSQTGMYQGEDFADESPGKRGECVMPPDATTIAPPRVKRGEAPVFNVAEQRWEVQPIAGSAGHERGTAGNEGIMKLIEAVIKPVKLSEVKAALQNIGIVEIMESTLICHGRQKGESMFYRGAELVVDFVEKIKLEIVAADESVGKIIDTIGTIAKTERRDDCRIFILPFIEAM